MVNIPSNIYVSFQLSQILVCFLYTIEPQLSDSSLTSSLLYPNLFHVVNYGEYYKLEKTSENTSEPLDYPNLVACGLNNQDFTAEKSRSYGMLIILHLQILLT